MQKRLTSTLALMLIGAILAACGMPGNPSPNPTPDPATDVTALVIEAVDSPIYAELAKTVKMVPYDGSQKASDHDMVILDGDAHSPDEVRDHPLVDQALSSGKWILGLDLSPEHQKNGLGAKIGFATREKRGAYMVGTRPSTNGRTVYRVIGDAAPARLSENLPGTEKMNLSNLGPGNPSEFAAAVTQTLQDGDRLIAAHNLESQDAPAPDTQIPGGLISQQWVYTYVGDGSITGSGKNPNGTQNYTLRVDYTLTAFLDNANNPQGNKQYVLVQIDGESNPAAGGDFIRWQQDERAYFQDWLELEFSPEGAFSWVSNDPSSPNGQTNYSANSGFSVGFTAGGEVKTDGQGFLPSVNASYSYSTSKSYTISDWTVYSDGSGESMDWTFQSTNPDVSKGYDSGEWADKSTGYPKVPNAISSGQLLFHASVAYVSNGLLDDWEWFNKSGELHLVDLYCRQDSGPTCYAGFGNDLYDLGVKEHYQVIDGSALGINLGALLPVPIKSVTFNGNPVKAGMAVTGTVTLEREAQIDTPIEMLSDSGNATVLPNVTVKQGHASANFEILTNANGLAQGASTTATFQAFYAQNFQQQLNIVNSDTPPLTLPTPDTAPTIDPADFASCAGTTGKWAGDYQVRYAASFTYAEGESARGPWTDWKNNSPHMLPVLKDVPTDVTALATGRKVYRQFQSDYSSNDPSAGVTLTGTLNDNTTTELADTDTAGTTEIPCDASISLSFDNTNVFLTDDPTRTGTVTLSEPATAGGVKVYFMLYDDDGNSSPNSATFPTFVTIPEDQTSAKVNITFTRGGPSYAFGFTLEAYGNWGQDQTEFTVSKFVKAPSVKLSFDDTTVHIADNPTRTGTVTISEPNNTADVEVNLSLLDDDGNSSPNSATFPASVTIPQGQTSAPVTITFINGGPSYAFAFYLQADGGDWGQNKTEFTVYEE